MNLEPPEEVPDLVEQFDELALAGVTSLAA